MDYLITENVKWRKKKGNCVSNSPHKFWLHTISQAVFRSLKETFITR